MTLQVKTEELTLDFQKQRTKFFNDYFATQLHNKGHDRPQIQGTTELRNAFILAGVLAVIGYTPTDPLSYPLGHSEYKWVEITLSSAHGGTLMIDRSAKQILRIDEKEIYKEGGGGGPSVPPCATNVRKELRRLGVPGLSAVIVKNGRVACTAVAGMANIEMNRPVKPETVFAWASVSKTVTAAAVMKLVDDGAFKLDDDINAYLPFPVRVPACPEKPITFLHLLTHTSSIIENEFKGVYAN